MIEPRAPSSNENTRTTDVEKKMKSKKKSKKKVTQKL